MLADSGENSAVRGNRARSIQSDTGSRARRTYASRIEKVIRHIEANLDSGLTLSELCRIAGFSEFHFHRQFSAYTGIAVGRLVLLLRLKRASLQLAFNPALSVTDIALEAGYKNSESFSRAFRRVYGQPPRVFRQSPVWQEWQRNRVIGRQEHQMNTEVEIVEFPATQVACVEYRGPHEQEYSAVMKLVAWRRERGIGPDDSETYGLHYSDPESVPPEEYRLDVCVAFEGEVLPNSHEVVAKTIPGGRCARVRHFGSRDYIEEAAYLYREWLPASGEEIRDCPAIFHYVNVGPDVKDADMITDVYLPLQ
jgi:AraC family transcriptional regulator